MRLTNLKKFENDMASFSFGQQQDFLNYIDLLRENGWTVEDAKEWIEQKKKTISESMIKAKSAIYRCPDCRSPMQLLKVNVSPATQTNDSSKSVWLCTNKECMNTIYNTESIEEILKSKGNKEKKNGAT